MFPDFRERERERERPCKSNTNTINTEPCILDGVQVTDIGV